MIDQITSTIASNPWLAPFVALLAGILTASNPCVLVAIPLMIGAAGAYQGDDRSYWKSLKFSLIFVLGISFSFTCLGLAAGLLGNSVSLTGPAWSYVVAVVCIVMGLMFAEVIQIKINPPKILTTPRAGLWGALVLGVMFGFISTPCAVPIIAVLLTLIASGGSPVYGGILLFSYSIGHSLLIIVAGGSVGAIQAYINNKNMTNISSTIKKLAGLLITAFGLYLLYAA
jgi:cytochrome c biogenesis protein CcdA